MRYSDYDWRTMEAEEFRKDDLRREQQLARAKCKAPHASAWDPAYERDRATRWAARNAGK